LPVRESNPCRFPISPFATPGRAGRWSSFPTGGLQLFVQPRGAKLWRLAYRFDGKQKVLAFGIYPVISLADARARRDAAKKLLANGVDPSTRRKLDKVANANSFRVALRNCSTRCDARDERIPHW
jgi:Arm DNA-binding domain